MQNTATSITLLSLPVRLGIAVREHLRAHALLWLIILFIGTYRTALVSVGQDYFPDEVRQHRAENMLDFMHQGNWPGAIWWLFSTQGRPGAVLIGLIPAEIQRWTGATTVVVSLLNAAVSLGIVWLFYQILLSFVPNRWQAVGGTALFVLVHSNSIYIRHLVSYDWALAIFMLACWLALRRKPMWLSRKQVVLIGILCGFGFSVYPGYYPLIGIIGLLVIIFNRSRIPTLLLFAFGVVIVLVLYQIAAQWVNISYLRLALDFASTINQGDYTEGYTFAISYLTATDGLLGVVLLVLFVVSVILAIKRRDLDPRIRGLIILTLLAYLAYGTLVFVLRSTVYYGRLIHAYVPFVAIGVVFALITLPQRHQRLVWGTVLVIGAISFISNAVVYLPQQYPKDIRVRAFNDYPGLRVCELITNIDWRMDYMAGCDIMAINARFLDPGMDTQMTFDPPPNWESLYRTTHPADYPPYQFEGYTPRERAAIQERPHQLAIYRIHH